jgi:NAD(P)-dependent dehydrogenase (short-subunit alcohol dehydrogenase family)
MASIDLSGRAVLITGAARGLGKSMALAFADAGASVFCVDLPSELHLLSESGVRHSRGQLHAIACDVSDWHSCEDLVRRCVATLGRLDVIGNNASMGMQTTTPRYSPIR